MDRGGFRTSPIGRLVAVSGTDWRTGRPYECLAYVPSPLPETVALADATRGAIGDAEDQLSQLDRRARKLGRAAHSRGPLSALAVRGSSDAHARGWTSGEPVTAARINGLHAALVRGTRGDWADAGRLRAGNVFLAGRSGPIERSRFVPAPGGAYLDDAFAAWIGWMSRADSGFSPVVQAGLAHYQFETLHPYSDGNGRLGRLLILLTLMRRGILSHPVLEIEAWLAGHRAEYQDRLLELSRTGDWDAWLQFFAGATGHAARITEQRLRELVDLRSGRPRTMRDCHSVSVAASLLAAVTLAACGGSSSRPAAGVKGSSEVQASPVSTAGTNPFSPTVGTDRSGVKPPAAATSTTGRPAQYVGSLPGLYGGTRNYKTCDAGKLVGFLGQNPAKAAAWASTLGISTTQISRYVDGLTPVLLRTDTRVTNHGYLNGAADPIQSVLQAGTAVFVNRYGEPVVKCYCGNPLTAPELLTQPVYTGPLWASFTTINITIIQPSPTIVNTYTLYDPNTGTEFHRSPGLNGHDGPYINVRSPSPNPPPSGPTTPTTPAPQPSTGSSTPAPSAQPAENPSVSLSPNPVLAGGTVTLTGSGFLPNKTLQITVNRPDGGTDPARSATSDAQGNFTYTFANAGGSLTGTYQVTVTDPDTNASSSASIEVLSPSNTTTSSTTS